VLKGHVVVALRKGFTTETKMLLDLLAANLCKSLRIQFSTTTVAVTLASGP
jgi:hypothetical protein